MQGARATVATVATLGGIIAQFLGYSLKLLAAKISALANAHYITCIANFAVPRGE